MRGQSLVEFSLAFPLFMLLVAVCFTGSQAMTSVIAAANDVSANSNVAPATELNDAVAAVNFEEGCNGCYVGVASQAACTGGQSCVWVVRATGTRTATPLEVIHVSHPVVAVIPLLSGITVHAQAAATP
jgi:Flp pilus assembly protein TadG